MRIPVDQSPGAGTAQVGGRVACIDGVLMPVGEAAIAVTDDGLLRGDGVFEVVRLYAGRPFALGEHLERMVASAANLRLAIDIDAVAGDVAALLAAASPGDGLLRLVVTRGGRRILLLEELPSLGPSLSLGYVVYSPPRVLDGIKSLSYAGNMLAGRLARERGHDEALLLTPHGRVLEAPTASFFWVEGTSVLTPPLDDHVLDSITRRRVIATADAREAAATREVVAGADEVFLASTVREVMPVHRVEERQYACPGPVTAELVQAVGRRIAAELAEPA